MKGFLDSVATTCMVYLDLMVSDEAHVPPPLTDLALPVGCVGWEYDSR